MAFDGKTLKRDGSGITPVPQHFNPIADDYEPIYGRNNAGRVELYGPDGNPISTDDSNKLAVRASEIETILNEIKSKDFATQTTLAQILAKIIAAPATEAKQDTIIGHVDGVEGTLTALNGKDFATQTTLAAILSKIVAAPATEAKQTALNALIGEVQAAPTANTLLARLKNLETKVDAIIADGVKLSGSIVTETQTVSASSNYRTSIINCQGRSKIEVGYSSDVSVLKSNKSLDLRWYSDEGGDVVAGVETNVTVATSTDTTYGGATQVPVKGPSLKIQINNTHESANYEARLYYNLVN